VEVDSLPLHIVGQEPIEIVKLSSQAAFLDAALCRSGTGVI
jgi:hypothetical protein